MRVDGPAELIAATVKLAADDLETSNGIHAYTAVVFLDDAGLLPLVCRARGLDYEKVVDVLLEGAPQAGKRR